MKKVDLFKYKNLTDGDVVGNEETGDDGRRPGLLAPIGNPKWSKNGKNIKDWGFAKFKPFIVAYWFEIWFWKLKQKNKVTFNYLYYIKDFSAHSTTLVLSNNKNIFIKHNAIVCFWRYQGLVKNQMLE